MTLIGKVDNLIIVFIYYFHGNKLFHISYTIIMM